MSRVLSSSVGYPKQRVLSSLTWVVLATYYAFVFSIPFQSGIPGLPDFGTISRWTGYLFIMASVLKPRMCYKRPGIAFYCFAIYLLVLLLSGFLAAGDSPVSYDWGHAKTLLQLFLLFWVSSSLLSHDNRTIRHVLFVLASSCVVLATVMALGLSAQVMEGRATTLDANPNTIAGTLMVGLLALVGLAYGRQESSRTARACFWFFSAFLFLGIIKTGSRGAVIALLAGLLIFLVKRASLGFRFKIGIVLVLSVAFIVIASSTIESVSERWQKTFAEGDTSGREEIYPLAWQMVKEKPILGWGPAHQNELGSRLGLYTRDFHNLYLHVLSEVGLVGAVPFFLGLLACCLSAWRARKNIQGILPMAMLMNMLVISAGGTTMEDKLLWFVFAYVTASGTYPLLPVLRRQQSLAVLRLPRDFVPSPVRENLGH